MARVLRLIRYLDRTCYGVWGLAKGVSVGDSKRPNAAVNTNTIGFADQTLDHYALGLSIGSAGGNRRGINRECPGGLPGLKGTRGMLRCGPT